MQRWLFIVLFFICSDTNAQIDDQDTVDLSSPYKSLWTTLHYLQPEHYNDSLAAQPFNPKRRGLERAKKAAIEFKQVLDGNGIYLFMDEIPKSSNYFDSTINKHRYVVDKQLPDVYLLKRPSTHEWVFSDAAMRGIAQAHEETFKFGSDILLEWLPRLGSRKYFGLFAYQYVAILLLALISAVTYKIFTVFSEIFIRKALMRAGHRSGEGLLPLARPTSLFIIILLLNLFIPVLQLPAEISQYVVTALHILVPLFATIIAFRFVNIFTMILMQLAEKTESTLDDQLVPLLRKTLKTFVVIIGLLFILQALDVPILPLLTGLSIGGLAFALAAQDTIKNFFGSLMIFVDKPFQIGDWITSNDVDGTVEEVGFRSSRVRTFRNSVMYIPNGKLADQTIDNHGLRKYRRFYTTLALTYDTPPGLVQSFVEGLRKIHLSHPMTNKDNFHIYFNNMGSHSLDIMFYIFIEAPDWGQELKTRHEILLQIMQLAEKMGVHFAFPTQTLHVENLPGQPSLSPNYLADADIEKEMDAFFKKA